MGHTTCGSGHRCCDRCDGCRCTSAAPRRSDCPAGWCQPDYLCRACRVEVGPAKIRQAHQNCTANRNRHRAEQAARKHAEADGLPVIRAGVGLPNGDVYAWTTQGNYQVSADAYRAGVEHPAKVLNLNGSIRRADEMPPEVYGR